MRRVSRDGISLRRRQAQHDQHHIALVAAWDEEDIGTLLGVRRHRLEGTQPLSAEVIDLRFGVKIGPGGWYPGPARRLAADGDKPAVWTRDREGASLVHQSGTTTFIEGKVRS